MVKLSSYMPYTSEVQLYLQTTEGSRKLYSIVK